MRKEHRTSSRALASLFSLFGSSNAAADRRRLVNAGTQEAEAADRRLLRSRLQSVAIVLLLASLAFFLKNIALNSATPRIRDGLQIGLLLLVTVGLMRYRAASFTLLRTVEVILFLCMALDFSWTLNARLAEVVSETESVDSEHQAHAHVIEFVAAIKDQVIAMFGLMMIYGMFIPNTVQRSAVMITLMAVIPGAVIFSSRTSNPFGSCEVTTC
jgi:hypothetical protein